MFKNRSLFVSFIFSAIFLTLLSCSGKSTFVLENTPVEENLITIKKGTNRIWHFTESQQEAFKQAFLRDDNAAIECIISVKNYKKIPKSRQASLKDFTDRMGFVYEEDFVTPTKLVKNPETRSSVSTNLFWFSGRTFRFLLSADRSRPLPTGFFISSHASYTVSAARITSSAIGFDYSGQYPLAAYGPNGGFLKSLESYEIDLSGSSMAFPASNTKEALMSKIDILYSKEAAQAGKVFITIGGEKITLRPNLQMTAVATIYSAALKAPFSTLEVQEDCRQFVSAVLVHPSDKKLLSFSSKYPRSVLAPIPVDPGLVMGWPSSSWRGEGYELFSWDRFPNILLFDTSTYSIQDDFFRRLAFFSEKAGYRGKLMDDEFLSEQHGYNAHDYRAETLAAFFEKARLENFPLNERELLLKEILAANGVIIIDGDGSVKEGEGAVLSISQESPSYLRWTFIAHEAWHGIFFIDGDFRNTVASLYYTMDQSSLQALIKYFTVTPTLNYDTEDDYLMKNEFMAYMLQRPMSQVRDYYLNMMKRWHAQDKMKEEADYVISTNADGFVGAATMLEEYALDRWNLAAGRVWLISR